MTEVPSLSHRRVVRALQRAGFIVVRQRGSHIRMQKRIQQKVVKTTVPAHNPVKRSTLSRIIKDSSLTVEEFNELV